MSRLKFITPLILGTVLAACSTSSPEITEPPFGGTIFIDPDIITSDDPTAFSSISYTGRGQRTMFDRRVNSWIENEAFLFHAEFDDGLTTEVQVNSEFETPEAALVDATIYAREIGRVPTALRVDMNSMWIHKGEELFGGGNNNVLIHTGQAANYVRDGILAETLVHEASHTSLDARYANHPDWRDAQSDDPTFISTYARDNPDREDIAESFLPYLAIRYRSDRIDDSLKNAIERSMPNRISFFDELNLEMYPISSTASSPASTVDSPESKRVQK